MAHIKGHINESLSIFPTQCKIQLANIHSATLVAYFYRFSSPRIFVHFYTFPLLVKLDQAFQLFPSRSFNLNSIPKVYGWKLKAQKCGGLKWNAFLGSKENILQVVGFSILVSHWGIHDHDHDEGGGDDDDCCEVIDWWLYQIPKSSLCKSGKLRADCSHF